jgi:hypothetical protein
MANTGAFKSTAGIATLLLMELVIQSGAHYTKRQKKKFPSATAFCKLWVCENDGGIVAVLPVDALV